MIKVGFDISQLAHNGGVATYTANLAAKLAEFTDLEMVYFYSSLRRPYQGSLRNVKKFKLPPTFFELLFNKLHNVPIERFLGPVDVFHSSDWVQPPSKARKVTTFHDLVPLKHPELSHPKIVEVNRRRLEVVKKEVDMVIAVSEATRKDLIEVSGLPDKKITVIYEGVGEEFKPQPSDKVEQFKKRYGLGEFVLAIGGVGKRRNLERIKEASKKFNLVVSGETIPRVPNSEMPLLYAAAKILFYPSLYEGFGLPILEAMACGTPVITSNVSSMPEVAGNAAVLVNPENVSEMSIKLEELMSNKSLRKEMITKGLKRAKQFSWDKCARQTANIYKKLCQ